MKSPAKQGEKVRSEADEIRLLTAQARINSLKGEYYIGVIEGKTRR